MREVYHMLQDEKNRLEKLADKLRVNLLESPEARINVHVIRGKYNQYTLLETNKDGITKRYARKCEIDLVKRIAQADYDRKALEIIDNRINDITTLLDNVNNNSLPELYTKLPEARKTLVFPLEIEDDEYIEKWKSHMILNENSFSNTSNIYTEKGEQVRSKSEKILADALLHNNVPYVYEPKIVLDNGKYLFPDFCLLNVRLRKTYYYEHFGMMDNQEYLARMIEKMEEYHQNGYWEGKNLLYSFETQYHMPDMRNINRMINKYLK